MINETDDHPPPPPRFRKRLTTTLAVALGISVAAPAWAQVPTITLRAAGETRTEASGCIENLTLLASGSVTNLPVTLIAYTVDGYDRFRDHGISTLINDDASRAYRSCVTVTMTGSPFVIPPTQAPCFPDDRVDAGPSTIAVALLGGAGTDDDPHTFNYDQRMVQGGVYTDSTKYCPKSPYKGES